MTKKWLNMATSLSAEQNRFQLIPAIFSHTGQIHDAFKDFLREQIRYKIVAFEGYAKSSNISSTMKWWSKCISMVIAKTASRVQTILA